MIALYVKDDSIYDKGTCMISAFLINIHCTVAAHCDHRYHSAANFIIGVGNWLFTVSNYNKLQCIRFDVNSTKRNTN